MRPRGGSGIPPGRFGETDSAIPTSDLGGGHRLRQRWVRRGGFERRGAPPRNSSCCVGLPPPFSAAVRSASRREPMSSAYKAEGRPESPCVYGDSRNWVSSGSAEAGEGRGLPPE